MQHVSEYKFVEWSRDTSAESDDLAAMIACLKERGDHPLRVLDVGGGIGTTALALVHALPHVHVDVIERSDVAKQLAISHSSIHFTYQDFFDFVPQQKYDAIVFRTVLHHFIADTQPATHALQQRALLRSKDSLTAGGQLFITENFYEPFFGKDTTGALIYQITALQSVQHMVRRLGANTAGEGVRFRSLAAWKNMFAECSLQLDALHVDRYWGKTMPWWQKVPLLCRRRYQALAIASVAVP